MSAVMRVKRQQLVNRAALVVRVINLRVCGIEDFWNRFV